MLQGVRAIETRIVREIGTRTRTGRAGKEKTARARVRGRSGYAIRRTFPLAKMWTPFLQRLCTGAAHPCTDCSQHMGFALTA